MRTSQFMRMYVGIRKKRTDTDRTAIYYGGCSHATIAARSLLGVLAENVSRFR